MGGDCRAGNTSFEEDAPDPRDAEIAALKAERDQALAANAEMRAALEAIDRECLGYTTWAFEARAAVEKCRALLSRPDLGASKVLVEREVVQRCRQTAYQCGNEVLVADLDALLKKGGGT